MQPKQIEDKDPISYWQIQKQMCAKWRITIPFFRVVREVFKLKIRVAQAARNYQYNRQYAWRTIKRLREEGLEQEIIEFFNKYDDPTPRKIEFWDHLERRIKADEWKALELYGRIQGFIKQGQPIERQTNVQINSFMLDKIMKKYTDKGEEEPE